MTSSSDNLFNELLSQPDAAPAPVVEDDAPTEQPNELELLKNRARTLGISFSNNIGVESLKKKIQDKLDGNAEQPEAQETKAPTAAAPVYQTLRQKMVAEEMKLVRLRITNMDPKKKDLPGEIFTFANSILGTVRKYVPYGEVTDNGYHVPYCIYKQLRDRKFLNIRVRKVDGKEVVETSWAQEFSLEVLPPLTKEELARLAAAQAAKQGID